MTMKHFKLTFVLTMLMSMVGVNAFADFEMENADGVTIYYEYCEDGLAVNHKMFSSTPSYSGRVVIPEEVTYNGKTLKVKFVLANAFHDCSELTAVTIPSSMTKIDLAAFSGCTSLASVTINSNIIASKSLKSYESDKNLTKTFGKQVKEIIFGDKVTSIGNYAFKDCTDLESVIIPNSITSIGIDAFSGCI